MLVKATTDAEFIAEVSKEMEEQSTHLRTQTTAMIDEYLRRQVEAASAKLQQKLAAQEERFAEERQAYAADRAALQSCVEKTQSQLAKVVAALLAAQSREVLQRAFSAWRWAATQRKADAERAAIVQHSARQQRAARALAQWRLFAKIQQHQKRQAKATQVAQCREAELKGALEVYQEKLSAEHEPVERASRELRDALVHGRCTLNREAVSDLRGKEYSEEDVAAIQAILSKRSATESDGRDGLKDGQDISRGTARSSGEHHYNYSPPNLTPSTSAVRPTAGGVLLHRGDSYTFSGGGLQLPAAVCPVHMRDADGLFYHPCYSPETCHLGMSRSPITVRAEVASARSYRAGPPLKSRTGGPAKRRC